MMRSRTATGWFRTNTSQTANQLIKSCRKVNKVAISCLRLFAKQFRVQKKRTRMRGLRLHLKIFDNFSSLQVCDLNHGRAAALVGLVIRRAVGDGSARMWPTGCLPARCAVQSRRFTSSDYTGEHKACHVHTR